MVFLGWCTGRTSTGILVPAEACEGFEHRECGRGRKRFWTFTWGPVISLVITMFLICVLNDHPGASIPANMFPSTSPLNAAKHQSFFKVSRSFKRYHLQVLTICEDFGLNQLGDRILEQSLGSWIWCLPNVWDVISSDVQHFCRGYSSHVQIIILISSGLQPVLHQTCSGLRRATGMVDGFAVFVRTCFCVSLRQSLRKPSIGCFGEKLLKTRIFCTIGCV